MSVLSDVLKMLRLAKFILLSILLEAIIERLSTPTVSTKRSGAQITFHNSQDLDKGS